MPAIPDLCTAGLPVGNAGGLTTRLRPQDSCFLAGLNGVGRFELASVRQASSQKPRGQQGGSREQLGALLAVARNPEWNLLAGGFTRCQNGACGRTEMEHRSLIPTGRPVAHISGSILPMPPSRTVFHRGGIIAQSALMYTPGRCSRKSSTTPNSPLKFSGWLATLRPAAGRGNQETGRWRWANDWRSGRKICL